MKLNKLNVNKLLFIIMLVGSFLLMGCVGEELKFMDVKMQIDENGNATRVSMKMSYLINKTEVDNFLLEIEDTDGLGVTLSEWNSLSEVDQLELLLTKSVEDREMGGGFSMDSHEVSETETDYIITFTMFSSSTEEVDGFIINGDEAILTLGRKEFIGIGEISSFSGGYMQIVYFLPYQIKTVDANMEHELVNGGIRVKLDESSLTNPTLKVTMDRTKVVENLDEKFNSYDGNVNSNNGKSTVSKNVKKDTEEESEGSSLIDWAYDNFGGVLELLPGDRKTKFYIFAAAVVFIVLKLFSGGKKE